MSCDVVTRAFESPSWHPTCQPLYAYLLSTEQGQHLVLDGPNWANAKRWAAELALQAWRSFREERPVLALPGDLAATEPLHLWLVEPGFPADRALPLWKEPFSRYGTFPRHATLVYPLSPEFGTPNLSFGSPVGWEVACRHWGLPVGTDFSAWRSSAR